MTCPVADNSGTVEVLIVEDDQDVCDAVSETLVDAGYAVLTAMNGALALSALRASNELPCLILLDLMMPVMDGERFLQEMGKDPRLSRLPVVLLTADGPAITDAVTHLHLDGLRKPVEMSDLLLTVSKYCTPQTALR
jgi:two-component system, chemotaxis family, chemotaxis protein CheY